MKPIQLIKWCKWIVICNGNNKINHIIANQAIFNATTHEWQRVTVSTPLLPCLMHTFKTVTIQYLTVFKSDRSIGNRSLGSLTWTVLRKELNYRKRNIRIKHINTWPSIILQQIYSRFGNLMPRLMLINLDMISITAAFREWDLWDPGRGT